MTGDLLFDAASHTYVMDGRTYPSVTRVLELAGLVDKTWFTDFGRERGTHVHTALEWYDHDDLNEATLDEQLVPYLTAWRAFLRDSGAVWSHVEHRMADPTLGVAGTLDRFGTIADKPAIVDIKSGHPEDYIGLQLAGYAYLAEVTGLTPSARRVRRMGVFVRADGTYRVVDYTERTDLEVFRAALTVAQWRLAHPRTRQEAAA